MELLIYLIGLRYLVNEYVKSEKYNYYFKQGIGSISYSDGENVEDGLYETLRSTNDKSVLSDELASKILDWPSEYHFSRLRHCLLKHLPFKADDSVLELGCGCGAITRFLGETGAQVDSVEGTHSRARIAGERCIDLSNVTVYVDDLLKFTSNKKYDWVLLIGVLEYAPIFSNEDDAVLHYLNVVKKYLSPTGRLVLAIENKLGLKYFNGCSEDHVNEPFFGLENRYKEKTPVTFGKIELSGKLKDAGFKNINYYYPFPDYKLPNVVISESAISNALNVSDLFRGKIARDYSGRVYRSFDETFVWREIEKNSLLTDLSNSFLVVSSISESRESRESREDIIWYYNINRLRRFVTQTVFEKCHDEIVVKKRCMSKISADDIGSKYSLKILDESFIYGCSLQSALEDSWHKSGDMNELILLYREWFSFILDKSNIKDVNSLFDASIGGDFIDLTPFNIKYKDCNFYYYDQEWKCNERIPVSWLMFRGVYWSLIRFNSSKAFHANVFEVLEQIAVGYSVGVDKLEVLINSAILLEKEFIKFVTGDTIDIQYEVNKIPSNLLSNEQELANLRTDLLSVSLSRDELIKENLSLKNELEKYRVGMLSKGLKYIRRVFNKHE